MFKTESVEIKTESLGNEGEEASYGRTESVEIKTEPFDNEGEETSYKRFYLNNNTEYPDEVEFKTENQANFIQSDKTNRETNYLNNRGFYPTTQTDVYYNYNNGHDDDDTSSDKSLDLHMCEYNCEKSLFGRFKLPTFDSGNCTRRRQCFNAKTSLKAYKCQFCCREFHQMANLNSHLEYTHGVKAYFKCNGCFRMINLKITKGQPCSSKILCDRCENKLRGSQSSRKIRVGNKYRCNVCSKLLCSPYVLADHMRIHTGEKPFKCELCSKQYTKASTLTNHLKIVHRLIKRNVIQYHPV